MIILVKSFSEINYRILLCYKLLLMLCKKIFPLYPIIIAC